jgi:hypothetical protein
MDASSLIFQSVQLRAQSDAFLARARNATIQLRSLTDAAALARTEARRLRAEATNLAELRRQALLLDWRWRLQNLADLHPDTSVSFTDGEISEDQELLSQLNTLGYRCDHCGGAEPLVAVVRFSDLAAALGMCGDCYRELSGLALGQVM